MIDTLWKCGIICEKVGGKNEQKKKKNLITLF